MVSVHGMESYVLAAGYLNSKPAYLFQKVFANIMYVTCYDEAACFIRSVIDMYFKRFRTVKNNIFRVTYMAS